MTRPDSKSVVAPSTNYPKNALLEEGFYTIRRETHDCLVDASSGGSSPSATPHPGLAIVATLAATGASIEDILALNGASPADGPMMAECRVVTHHTLEFDIEYRVTREIQSLERKKSRRFGEMDLLRFVAAVFEPGGECVAKVVYSWVLPKQCKS